ncbi:thioesterase family protein [Fulvivirga maritima]|uniref:acyl-CoA thioesterase n=1 Tax=Fulvivirga maritima TaxID=2904247 RepID=UPI001F386FED|nr:acyl-CoA thioesterase [Fulvivirga maritima]UII27138.1 thioesterase family protein [Fulvivirga maritima]
MSKTTYPFSILWSQIDANQHLRHSAYADFGAQARVIALESIGFDMKVFHQLKIGPILFREEMIYLREVTPNDTIQVSVEMVKCRKDGSRWSIKHEIFRSDGVKAAQINVDGAWLDLTKRKLAPLPEEWGEKFLSLPKAEEFSIEE